MKKILFLILSVFLMPDAFSQYFNTTQISVLMGNRPINERRLSNTGYLDDRTHFFPSVTMTNGKRFNEHWAAGVGVGVEIFDRYLFPVFADVRYTLWGNKVSPFIAFKLGYSFGNSKKIYYDNLTIHFDPYRISNADYKKGGGMLLHPEAGVTIPLSNKTDLLFTVAYRYQKTKSTVTPGEDAEWKDKFEHKESINRLSFGVGITFR